MTPDQVRTTRKKLGLSQRDAGQLSSGGPKGVQKYGSGSVILTKSADTALRLLSNDPTRPKEFSSNVSISFSGIIEADETYQREL